MQALPQRLVAPLQRGGFVSVLRVTPVSSCVCGVIPGLTGRKGERKGMEMPLLHSRNCTCKAGECTDCTLVRLAGREVFRLRAPFRVVASEGARWGVSFWELWAVSVSGARVASGTAYRFLWRWAVSDLGIMPSAR
jgi:hypothetical protein